MKVNRLDRQLALMNKRVTGYLDYLLREFDVRPFNEKKVEGVDYLHQYETLNKPENAQLKLQLMQKYGAETWMEFEKKALKSKEARGL